MPKLDYVKLQKELFKRTEGYAYSVLKHYWAAYNQIIDIVKGTELVPGQPFNFSDYGYSEQVTPIFRQMYSNVYQTIRGGVQAEWLKSNEHTDDLVKAVFGKNSIEDHHFARYFARNKEAMDAFFARKSGDGGLNLSQKVWKYSGEFKEELENTLDLAIGEGTPAMQLASKVRQYLNDPDRWYRRFRYKVGEDDDGKPIYGLKWKRRVWDDETGTYKWIDAKPSKYSPGRGVYRSSARNAQRLARTETNLAYRTADYDRWQQLDFVIGVEIKLSNNHPCTDICDDLKGIYPKDFKWTGWHPNCRCYMEPVLATQEDVDKMLDNIMDGKDPTEGVAMAGEVKKMPQEFGEWIQANEERMRAAKERGTLPYFIRDNEGLVAKALGGDVQWDEPSILAKAAERHAARTTEQVAKIKNAWETRKQAISLGESVLSDLRGISDIDLSGLEQQLNSANYQEALKLAKQLDAVKKEIEGYNYVVDPLEVARQYGMAGAKSVQNAISKTIDTWLNSHGYKSWDDAPLAHKKAKLDQEIMMVTSQHKYTTWQVAAKSYEKLLAEVQDKIDWQDIGSALSGFKKFKTKSIVFNGLVADLEKAIAARDKLGAKLAVSELNAKQIQLETAAAKKAAKAKVATSGGSGYTDVNTTKQTCHLSDQGDRPITVAQQLEKIKELTGCTQAEAEAYYRAVNGFSYQWDWEIRQVHCGNTAFKSRHGHSMEEIIERANNLEKFVENSPKWSGSITYRGMSLSQKEFDNLMDELKRGDGNMLGAASWSTNVDVSRNFSRMHLGETSDVFGDRKTLKVVLYSDTQVRATSIQHLSEFFGEYEILCSKTARYEFVSTKQMGDYIFIKVKPSI